MTSEGVRAGALLGAIDLVTKVAIPTPSIVQHPTDASWVKVATATLLVTVGALAYHRALGWPIIVVGVGCLGNAIDGLDGLVQNPLTLDVAGGTLGLNVADMLIVTGVVVGAVRVFTWLQHSERGRTATHA
jgi:lipoprotein signal peptidase